MTKFLLIHIIHYLYTSLTIRQYHIIIIYTVAYLCIHMNSENAYCVATL